MDKIAEIREIVTCFMGAGNDTEYDRALNTLKENAGEWIPFLLFELEREREENHKLLEERDEARSKAEEAWKEIDSLEEHLLSSQQEIERLREERNKLIEVLRWYADKTNYIQEVHHLRHGTLIGPAEAIYYDEGQRARDILHEIGVTVE